MQEHRNSSRIPTAIYASVLPSGEQAIRGIIRNISRDGLFIQTHKPLPKYKPVLVCFNLPTAQALPEYRLKAMVAHADNGGVGMMADRPITNVVTAMRNVNPSIGHQQASRSNA